MKTMIEMLMSLVLFLVIIQVLMFFISRTFVGKTILLLFKLFMGFCKYNYLAVKKCEVMTKYEGYIDKQLKQIDQFKKLENKKSPKSSNQEVVSKKVVNLNNYRSNKQ